MKKNSRYFAILTISILSISILGWGVTDPDRRLARKTGSGISEDLSHAPRTYVSNGKSFVSVDILSNDVHWQVTNDLSVISAEATVTFQVSERGYPYLLLNSNASVLIDNKLVSIFKMEGDEFSRSNYCALNTEVMPDTAYTATFRYSFQHDPKKTKHILPLEYYSHRFVEAGIPANAMFDRYPLNLSVSVDGDGDFHLFANGNVTKKGPQKFFVEFPERFTSMSFFIDLVPVQDVVKEERVVTSVDGRRLKAIVYSTTDDNASKWVSTFAGIVDFTFYEMEKFMGVYPQDTLILKVSDKEVGGGAYAGAMVLSSDYMEHISHELGHSWMLQSVTPANGADSWIYEGFGNWAPLFGYRSGFAKDRNLESSIYLRKGPYRLWATDQMFPIKGLRVPHQTGSMILASIDQYIKVNGGEELKGGLMPVLTKIAAERRHQTMSTMDFKALLEKHTGLDFTDLFGFYIGDD